MNREIVNADLANTQVSVAALRKQIAAETDCATAVGLVAVADTIEETMAKAGYRNQTETMRPVNEARFEARWKLGQLLAKVERDKGGRPEKNSSRAETGFRAYLREIGLNKDRANEAQGIAARRSDGAWTGRSLRRIAPAVCGAPAGELLPAFVRLRLGFRATSGKFLPLASLLIVWRETPSVGGSPSETVRWRTLSSRARRPHPCSDRPSRPRWRSGRDRDGGARY